MKALVQEGRGSADVLHVREIPVPRLQAGAVIVRLRAASVNALDWHTTHGGFLLDAASKLMRSEEEPVRGVDLAGTVEAVGPGVTRFKPGDGVFGGAPGAFAEFVRAREDSLAAKPGGITFEQAATLGVAGRTALQGLRDRARVKPGRRVLIYGAGGGVGTFAVQIAKILGARVTAVTGPRNVELVGELGADEVYDASRDDSAWRAPRFDVVFDIAATRSVSDLRRRLAPNGVFVLVGAAKGGWARVFGRIASVFVRGRLLRQRVDFFVARRSLDDLAFLGDLAVAGKLRPVIERVFPLSEAREAVRYIGTGRARGKIVIVPD